MAPSNKERHVLHSGTQNREESLQLLGGPLPVSKRVDMERGCSPEEHVIVN